MSGVPRSTTLLLVVGTLFGSIILLLVVEFGISAGQVHRGVTVAGYDVSGLSFTELQATLEERGAKLRQHPACFSGDGVSLCVSPADLGWRPEPGATAERAYEVGRTDFPFGALAERAAAWMEGVNVKWEGSPKVRKVDKLLNEWEELFSDRGLELERGLMRYKLRRAIITYPRETFRIPLH
ncbi:MAG: hypothetical protein ACRDJ2_10190 [Actinomycetota bacterium]